jgi:hypothetical protein
MGGFKSVPGLRLDKSLQFLEETFKGGFAFEHDMVCAFQRNEAGVRDARGHPPAQFKGHTSVVAGVHHQRRRLDLRQQRAHVGFAVGQKVARGVGGRTRDSLKLVEPVGQLLGGARNELGCEHLPE